jgi:putative transcriptional regulator
MTITHHPTESTLAAFAAGSLDEGRSVVVAAHVSLCSHCRHAIRTMEHVGGALLDRATPVPLRAEAVDRTMATIGSLDPPVRQAAPPATRPRPDVLAHYELGPWRWIGRGVQWRPVGVPVANDIRVFMLKVAPGTRLPHHRHEGTELTCVFEGAFRHDLGRYGPGDFDEADDTVEHRPFIEAGVPCVSLVALQGNIRLEGWFGRLLQPLVRF